ncbi:MAG: response regulator [Woeseiaceae bacterium]|nr:response regulator [Woeseiaceae bacterium]
MAEAKTPDSRHIREFTDHIQRFPDTAGKPCRVEYASESSLRGETSIRDDQWNVIFMNAGPVKNAERILLVDDNDSRRKDMTLALRRQGYDVVHTADSRSGFRELLVEGADLLLAAASMPHFSGIELASVTKKLRPEMHVMLMVGDSKSFELPARDTMNPVHTVSVPCDLDRICNKVRFVLDNGEPMNTGRLTSAQPFEASG